MGKGECLLCQNQFHHCKCEFRQPVEMKRPLSEDFYVGYQKGYAIALASRIVIARLADEMIAAKKHSEVIVLLEALRLSNEVADQGQESVFERSGK